MAEELEIEVRTTSVSNDTPPLSDIVRNLVLAGIGAIAQTQEDTESFVKTLIAQRELAQKESEKLLSEMSQRLWSQRPLQRLDMSPATSFEQFLNRLNIPSKRDIDDLGSKIAQLSARMEELQHSRNEGSK